MIYEAEEGRVNLALCGDIMPFRHLSVFAEPNFLALRELLRGTDACFANLESMVVRYDEGTPPIRTGAHMVTEPELLEDLKWFGFNLLSCAISHALNFGEEGLLAQNRHLDAVGIAHTGTGENQRQASAPAYLDTPNGRMALVAATAHLPSEQNRAANQRVDFRGKPGVNPLGFQTTVVVDKEALVALRRLGTALGFDRQRQRVIDHGFHSDAEIGAATQVEYKYRGDPYLLGDGFDIRTMCDEDDVKDSLRQIGEALRQADWAILSLHNQDLIGRSWLTATTRTQLTAQTVFVHDFAHRCIDAGADVFAAHGPHILMGIEIYRGKPIFSVSAT
ncbi:MAG TPA: CapA family protein [Terriglobales bacterium]|jgi:poly-gamma-glutamate synthesis protein (capsule biosynthesis protein)|nr:CapA family protein [Terriglobales bacterium]